MEVFMYLAPLNYDRFFKKIFNDNDIAKAFLEDFFDVKIQEIKKLDEHYRLTDKSRVVEFDYRCKIADKYVIIDMQQWYKQDIIQRFYLYHCLNTSLQLQDLDLKRIYRDKEGKERKEKDYRKLCPAITIVWLVDDSLGTDNNTITSYMQPEELDRFINENDLWANGSLKELKEKRKEILTILNNKTKDLNFLGKNKLTFALQKNIVRNIEKKKELPKYANWFALAEKTKDEKNIKKDFVEFEVENSFKDRYIKVKQIICKDALTKEEMSYILDEKKHQEEIQRGIDTFVEQGEKKAKAEFEKEKETLLQKAEEADKKAEEEKKKAEEADKKAEMANKRAEALEKEIELLRANNANKE